MQRFLSSKQASVSVILMWMQVQTMIWHVRLRSMLKYSVRQFAMLWKHYWCMKTLLLNFLPQMLTEYFAAGVTIIGCGKTQAFDKRIQAATEADWATEYGDLRLSVKIVSGLEEALAHIAKYGTKHSECIVTSDYNHARTFQQRVDAAAVYVNASTRFTDGFEFGFGAEIGISTQKLHARGPMALPELTSSKYLISGDGQIRG